MPSATSSASARSSAQALCARLLVTMALSCATVAGGCTGGRPSVELHQAGGQVEFGGKPPVGARITLHPTDGDWPLDSLPSATIGPGGAFRLGTLTPDDGAPAGTYVATLQWFRVGADGTVGSNALPVRYASPSTSPLTISIVPGQTELPTLRLVR